MGRGRPFGLPFSLKGEKMFFNAENEMPTNNKAEKLAALDYYKDYILNGRQLVLALTLYWDDEKLCRVQAPNFENEQELYKQLASLMLLPNTIGPSNAIITFGYAVAYEDGSVRDSIVTLSVNSLGFIAEPFPFEVVNDEVVFDDKITVSDAPCYSAAVNEIVAMGMKMSAIIDFPSNVLLYLAEKSFDVQFFNGYTIESVDKASLGSKL
jgi:hypothetical protein